MEIKMKDKLLILKRFGIITKIETMYQTMLKIFYIKRSTDLGNLGSIPYESTHKCRSERFEYELRQAQAISEIQRMRNSR